MVVLFNSIPYPAIMNVFKPANIYGLLYLRLRICVATYNCDINTAARSHIVTARSHIVTTRSHIVTARSHIVTARSDTVIKHFKLNTLFC